jgi:pyruvate/2-oxoglutarate/acetoin dehydrogenase E1 component
VAAPVGATPTGQPITNVVFGGFMEPATTQVWAEMLSDRKFLNEISSMPLSTIAAEGFGPPATMAESSLPQAPRRVTLPPASISVYEFEVR